MVDTFSRLGIAVGLGLLIGLQRERTDARLAGFRTFPLVTLLGALCGLLAQAFGGWILAGGVGALAIVILGGNFPLLHSADERPGVTSEVTMLVMFGLGAYVMVGSLAVALASCGVVAVLLHLKPQLHSLAARIGDRDFRAVMQFALITLVILPVLPDRLYGPFDVLNPFRIWLMVVLIVAISLGGYVIYKRIGVRAGAWASGLLGGLISSTATTVSLARRSGASPGPAKTSAFVILIASAIVFPRIAFLLGATSASLLRAAWIPLAAMFAVLALVGSLNLPRNGGGSDFVPEQSNPTELRAALMFGCLYAAVLVAAAAGKEYFGGGGLFVVAMVSGLTDMDAITLSVSQLVNRHEITPGVGWRLILTAAMANLVFKTLVVSWLGGRELLVRVGTGFAIAAVIGIALVLAVPG